MHMRSCMRAYATVQELLCHETIANLSWVLREHRAGCRLPHALSPVSTKSVARRCFAQEIRPNPRELMTRSLLRCRTSITQSDDLRWCRPHPVCIWVALAACPLRLPVTEMHFRHFRASFLIELPFAKLPDYFLRRIKRNTNNQWCSLDSMFWTTCPPAHYLITTGIFGMGVCQSESASITKPWRAIVCVHQGPGLDIQNVSPPWIIHSFTVRQTFQILQADSDTCQVIICHKRPAVHSVLESNLDHAWPPN